MKATDIAPTRTLLVQLPDGLTDDKQAALIGRIQDITEALGCRSTTTRRSIDSIQGW